jgi:hypothetical protein
VRTTLQEVEPLLVLILPFPARCATRGSKKLYLAGEVNVSEPLGTLLFEQVNKKLIGYRYYDKKRIAPLFPFGFGLSYTTFSYSPLRLSAQEIKPDNTLQVSVDVTNTGLRAGKEVVQLYVRDEQARLQRPEKELKGFAKVHR